MKVLVTGAKGQLGYDVVKLLKMSSIQYIGVDIDDFNLTNENQTKNYIINYNPDIVIHCAAYTASEKAESEREICHSINVLGTRYIAEACKEIDATMLYISTDYVFDGEGTAPYKTTDVPNPINYYGETKYAGELEVQRLLKKYFVVRISWVFGLNGKNFVNTMLRLAKERNEISVVNDQVGSPTYTLDLSKQLIEMIKTDKYGIYHATNKGYCSWYEFAVEIFKVAGIDVKVNPITSEEYISKVKRPQNSRLEKDNEFFAAMPPWQDAVRDYIDDLM